MHVSWRPRPHSATEAPTLPTRAASQTTQLPPAAAPAPPETKGRLAHRYARRAAVETCCHATSSQAQATANQALKTVANRAAALPAAYPAVFTRLPSPCDQAEHILAWSNVSNVDKC